MSTQFQCQKQFSFKQPQIHSPNVKTALFQEIQFSISSQFSSIWPIDRTLSGATTPGHNEPESDGNDGVRHIPKAPALLE